MILRSPRCGLGLVGLLGLLGFSPAASFAEPTAAQPTLPHESLTITTRDGKAHAFSVELAKSTAQQDAGEMFRKSVPTDGGMIFLWGVPQEADMWMRNTLVPLDMVFIGADGRVHAIAEDAVPLSEAAISSQGPVLATLELAGGTAARLGIAVGDRVASPSLESRPPANAR